VKLQSGEYVNRTCPNCGKRLVLRQNRSTKSWFLGCEMWPECEYTEPLPEVVKLELAGAQRLPGF